MGGRETEIDVVPALLRGLIIVKTGLRRDSDVWEEMRTRVRQVPGDQHSRWKARQGQRPGGWSCLGSHGSSRQAGKPPASPWLHSPPEHPQAMALACLWGLPRWRRGEPALSPPVTISSPSDAPALSASTQEALTGGHLARALPLHLPGQVIMRVTWGRWGVWGHCLLRRGGCIAHLPCK